MCTYATTIYDLGIRYCVDDDEQKKKNWSRAAAYGLIRLRLVRKRKHHLEYKKICKKICRELFVVKANVTRFCNSYIGRVTKRKIKSYYDFNNNK